jgi:hypothetical protein
MRPKTFTYNQMIQFFIDINLPLTEEQVHIIGMLHKNELIQLENARERAREKRAEKKAKKNSKRIKRKLSIITINPAFQSK